MKGLGSLGRFGKSLGQNASKVKTFSSLNPFPKRNATQRFSDKTRFKDVLKKAEENAEMYEFQTDSDLKDVLTGNFEESSAEDASSGVEDHLEAFDAAKDLKSARGVKRPSLRNPLAILNFFASILGYLRNAWYALFKR